MEEMEKGEAMNGEKGEMWSLLIKNRHRVGLFCLAKRMTAEK